MRRLPPSKETDLLLPRVPSGTIEYHPLILVVSRQLGITQLLEVRIVVPVGVIVTLSHESCDLVQDGQVCSIVLCTELLTDLDQQLLLGFSQILVSQEDVDI